MRRPTWTPDAHARRRAKPSRRVQTAEVVKIGDSPGSRQKMKPNNSRRYQARRGRCRSLSGPCIALTQTRGEGRERGQATPRYCHGPGPRVFGSHGARYGHGATATGPGSAYQSEYVPKCSDFARSSYSTRPARVTHTHTTLCLAPLSQRRTRSTRLAPHSRTERHTGRTTSERYTFRRERREARRTPG